MGGMELVRASDVEKRIKFLVSVLGMSHIDPVRVKCFRSLGSSSRARARIWSFPKIWQMALETTPVYCLEVLSENFDGLSGEEQERVLIHELIHIPKNFSGALVPHRSGRRKSFRHYHDEVEGLFNKLTSYSYQEEGG